MIIDKNVIKFSLFFFVLTSMVFMSTSIDFNKDISTVVSNEFKLVYAQEPVASLATSVSNDDNNTLIFNNYENSEMDISLKYPSNFLIDESNSNETVKQVSFFPVYDDAGTYPETYISWFNVYVEIFYPPISDFPVNISSYLEDRTNSIQEEDEDVTIIETSTDSMLSGYPAYKLVTRSYSGNSTIDTIEIGTMVGNKLYSLSYEVNTADYEKSIPVANEMIYSFKVDSDTFSSFRGLLNNATELATIREKAPFIYDLLSELNLENYTSGSSMVLDSLNFNSSSIAPLKNFLTNSTSVSGIDVNSILNSASSKLDLQTICSIQLLSNLCTAGTTFSNPSLLLDNPLLGNENSLNTLAGLLTLSNNATTNDLKLSEIKQLLGPFGMLPSLPSSQSPQSPQSTLLPNDNNSSNSFEDILVKGNNNTDSTSLNNSLVEDSESINNSNSSFQNNSSLDILKMLEFLRSG